MEGEEQPPGGDVEMVDWYILLGTDVLFYLPRL
jgi:hypothetical protein